VKKFLALFIFCFFSTVINAQTTTISATVVDSDGQIWAGGSWTLQFIPNYSTPNINVYNINGTPLTPSLLTQGGALDGTGSFNTNAYQNGVISPGGSTWSLTICPNATAPCGTINFTAAGATQNLSTQVNAAIIAPRFTAVAGHYGYSDIETTLTTPVGGTYYNVPMSCQRYNNGIVWACSTFTSTGCTGATGNINCPGTITAGTLDATTLTLTSSNCTAGTYVKPDGTGCGTPNGNSPTSICTGSNCNYVAEGDSTSAGAFTMAPSQRWPDQLSQLPIFKSKVVFLNASVSGSTCASMTSRYVGTVQPHKPNGTTILKSFLSVLIGRNDLGNSAATEEACISAYVNQAKTDGFTVMLGTTLPATISSMPPLVPGGIVANITAMNSNAGTNQTIFTAANTFIAGTNVFLSNIGPTPTLGPPTCTATSLSGSAGVLTVSCANTFTSGQWVYFETGGTGAGWTYVNGLWIQILTTGLSGSQFQIPLGVGGTYTVSGTVSSSTGVGANLNNNYCTVEATGLSSTQFACAINGGNWTGSNTGTATPTLAVAWDAITVAQLTELQTVDDWIRRYPVCNLTVTTACVDYMIDLAQLLKDPGNAGIDTYDGTHELPSFAATMAQFAESILDVGSPVLPAQPLNSGVGPQFIQGVDTGQLVVHPQFWTYGANLQTDTIYQPYVNEFWDSSQDGVGGYLEKYNQASDYYFLCNGLTTCEHLTATTVNFPQIAPVVGPGCLQISSTGSVTSSGCITTTASPPLNSATCIKSLTASSVVLGYCSTVVSSSGTCTCN